MGDVMDISGIIASIVVAVGLFIWGRMKGKKDAANERLENNAKAHERAKEAGNEIDRMSGDSVAEWLRRRGKQ